MSERNGELQRDKSENAIEKLEGKMIPEKQEVRSSSPTAHYVDTLVSETFPDNPRGQELLETYMLKPMLNEEARELDQFLEAKPIELPEVLKVNRGIVVEVAHDAKSEKHIITKELNGCTATLVVSEGDNGDRRVEFTHYPSFAKDAQTSKLGELIVPPVEGNSSAVIFAHNKRTESMEPISLKLKGILGDDVRIEIVKYIPDKSMKGNGAILVSIPPSDSGKEVTYSTWFNSGTL